MVKLVMTSHKWVTWRIIKLHKRKCKNTAFQLKMKKKVVGLTKQNCLTHKKSIGHLNNNNNMYTHTIPATPQHNIWLSWGLDCFWLRGDDRQTDTGTDWSCRARRRLVRRHLLLHHVDQNISVLLHHRHHPRVLVVRWLWRLWLGCTRGKEALPWSRGCIGGCERGEGMRGSGCSTKEKRTEGLVVVLLPASFTARPPPQLTQLLTALHHPLTHTLHYTHTHWNGKSNWNRLVLCFIFSMFTMNDVQIYQVLYLCQVNSFLLSVFLVKAKCDI